MVRKESGTDNMNWFDTRMHKDFGIPKIYPLPVFSHNIPKEVALFINANKNLIVVSENHYPWMIKLLRLRFLKNMYLMMKWMTQSEITPYYEKHNNANVIALVNLHEESRKGLLG